MTFLNCFRILTPDRQKMIKSENDVIKSFIKYRFNSEKFPEKKSQAENITQSLKNSVGSKASPILRF